MHISGKSVMVLFVGMGLLPAQLYAQKKLPNVNPLKNGTLLEKVERSVAQSSQAVSQVRNFNVYQSAPGYGTVLGYQTHLTARALSPELGIKEASLLRSEWGKMPVRLQVAPLTQRAISGAFKDIKKVTLPEITQALYLWRLANADLMPQENSVMVRRARALLEKHWTTHKKALDEREQLPNVIFLQRLLDPSFTPKTYAQLAAQTQVYPKHITLDESGFPVPTEQNEEAYILDNYLMLARPYVMSRFNSSHTRVSRGEHLYTPFVLTREEQHAAEQLLALREQSVKIPQDPTIRQLLEIAYNQLESHVIPYSSAYATGPFFPEYEHTALYRAIKTRLGQDETSIWRASRDMNHLVVLDAVMGGVGTLAEWQNVSHISRVLDAFEKLCRETPFTQENAMHLYQLHTSLLEAGGIWEYLPESNLSRAAFDQLTLNELLYLKERVWRFSKLNVVELMKQ